MAKQIHIPSYFRSDLIEQYRAQGNEGDQLFSELQLSNFIVRISLHFGFCFGVKNALDIAYRAIEQNPEKRIFLLSEIIHNQAVNKDLANRGARFIFNTNGEEIFPIKNLRCDDVVIVPAFGVSLELQEQLKETQIDTISYDTTCPFVKKVWKKAAELGKRGFSIIIHGKKNHEETRATFSYSAINAPTLVIRNIEEAQILAQVIEQKLSLHEFEAYFSDAVSSGFNPLTDLTRIGIVNQTTMLASETQKISSIIKNTRNRI